MKNKRGPKSLKKELRTYTGARPMSVRTAADGTKRVSGYAIVWNSPSVDLGGFTEVCAPSMLTRTLKESTDVLLLRDHKTELLLARTGNAKTMSLSVDETGLKFDAVLQDSSIGNDTFLNVKAGNLAGNSFGFFVREDSWTEVNGQVRRTLLDVDLIEISICSFPAYPDTSVSTRSCPASLRSKLKSVSSDDDDQDCDPDVDDDCQDDADDEEERCACDCAECADGDCSACSDEDCDDEDCAACPQQDESCSDNLRVRSLFALRMK